MDHPEWPNIAYVKTMGTHRNYYWTKGADLCVSGQGVRTRQVPDVCFVRAILQLEDCEHLGQGELRQTTNSVLLKGCWLAESDNFIRGLEW